jgi:hypothetical protein
MRVRGIEINRRVIYLVVLLALSIPLVLKYRLPPVRMDDAGRFFRILEDLRVGPGEFAFVALDFGPNSKAENAAQAEVVLEHLMRKRIPVVLFSVYSLAEPFLVSLPTAVAARLEQELPGQRWEYGQDWLNLGYRPGSSLIVQAIPKSANLAELFEKDARGNYLRDLPVFRELKRLEQIKVLAEFTGLVGVFAMYLQYFKTNDYTPLFVHGCTSITIPEAFIYLDSGQINGLLGGVAGAAWYSELMQNTYPNRHIDDAQLINTGLGVAHLVVIAFIVLGNLSGAIGRRSGGRL